jgi:hypothetical protein
MRVIHRNSMRKRSGRVGMLLSSLEREPARVPVSLWRLRSARLANAGRLREIVV